MPLYIIHQVETNLEEDHMVNKDLHELEFIQLEYMLALTKVQREILMSDTK